MINMFINKKMTFFAFLKQSHFNLHQTKILLYVCIILHSTIIKFFFTSVYMITKTDQVQILNSENTSSNFE